MSMRRLPLRQAGDAMHGQVCGGTFGSEAAGGCCSSGGGISTGSSSSGSGNHSIAWKRASAAAAPPLAPPLRAPMQRPATVTGGGRWPCHATSTASRSQPPLSTTSTCSCLAFATARDGLRNSTPLPRRSARRQTPRRRLSSSLPLLMLPLLMLPLLVLMGGTGAAKRDLTVSKFDNAHIPWYHTGTKPLYYEGDSFVNSLPALLGVQQLKNWVTVFMFNRAVQRWALNCIYSYIKFGKARNYIVAATDESSLEACIQLRLPCYNASFVLGAQGASLSNSHLLISTDDYITMVWGKVMVLQRILDLHYNVHFSDVDVVYMRPVWPSYRQLFLRAQPDAIFMKETTMLDMVESPQVPGHEVSASGASRKREDERDPVGRINLFNTGVYAMRSNNGTRALVDTWLSMRKNEGLLNDQVMLNERAMKDYVVCESRATCAAARMAGKPAVLRHPTQFGPQGACPGKWDAPCEPIRLFVHVICRTGWDTGGEETKGRVLERYRLWLLDEALKPVYNEDDQARRHPFLPCQGPAWENYGTGQ